MMPLPIDTESFWAIRTSDPMKLYVDKLVWVIGLSFDSDSHELTDHCVEEWKEADVLGRGKI